MKRRVRSHGGARKEAPQALAAPSDPAAFDAQDDGSGPPETPRHTADVERDETGLASRWVPAWVTEIFAADLRSLAALRIVLAVIVLADLSGRSGNLLAHYTEEGVLPTRILLAEPGMTWRASLNFINDTLFVQALLFGITALAAVALLVGYRTRLVTVVVWVLMLSIQVRNPFVTTGADVLLRLLLFWSIFLPLGAWWSLDSRREMTLPRVSMRFVSMATVGLFLQIAFMYWFTAILKSGPEWRVDGSALYYAFAAEQYSGTLGPYLLQFPTLLTVLTFVALGIEAFAPFLLFCPIATGPVRTVGVLLIMSLQIGILLTMWIWFFPWLGAFCMVCFLPSWFWDRVIPRLRAVFPMHLSLTERFQDAAARIAQPWSAPRWARLVRWGSGGQPAFAGMAASTAANQWQVHPARLRMPGAPRALSSTDAPPRIGGSSLPANLLALCFLVYVFLINLATVSDYTIPASIRPFRELLGLRQTWNMFSPTVKQTDWYVIPGTLKDGSQVDLLAPIIDRNPDLAKPVFWDKPPNVRATFRDMYWRKYLVGLRDDETENRRLYFGKYICRTWNGWHPDGPLQLQSFDILVFEEGILPEGQRETPTQEVLWTHRCV